MSTSVFYSENKRITLDHDDVTTRNLSRIFEFPSHGDLYLVDDSNKAILPEENGTFGFKLNDRAHYKVVGRQRTDPISQAPSTPSAAAPSTRVNQSVVDLTGAGPSGSSRPFHANSPRPTFQMPGRRTLRRKVQIMELEGAKLICTRSTYVVLKEGEYNVPSVCLKVAESLNCDDEPFVLLDSKNQEIQDCPATQAKEFWLMQSRVVRACSEDVYNDFMDSRAPKKRKLSSGRASMELEDMEERVRSLLAMTNSLREVEARGKTAVILPLQLSDLRELIAALSCVICKGPISKPVATSCCSSLVGCKACLDVWWQTSTNCPKCNSENGRSGKLELKGLDNIFGMLLPVTSTYD